MDAESNNYEIRSTSNQSAEVSDIEISKTNDGTRRKVIRALIVQNGRNENQSVKISIVCQRRSTQVEWQDIEGRSLSSLHAGEAMKLSLDTEETYQLTNRLNDLYGIDQNGVMQGRRILNVANEDAVIETDEGRARLLRKIAQTEDLENIVDLIGMDNVTPAQGFAAAVIIADRQQKLVQFNQMMTDNTTSEHDWQQFLERNKWMFGVDYMEVLEESRLSIHDDTDIPYSTEGGFMDIVELKLPSHDFWKKTRDGSVFLYRGKYPVQGSEVDNGLAQLRNYILEAEKNVNNTDFIQDHGCMPLKPRGVLIIGRSNDWDDDLWKAYRLFNDELHGVQVITFDQLRERAQRAVNSFVGSL